MSEGFSTSVANAILDDLLGGTVYVQLHTGSPGAAGTANIAATTARAAATFGDASGGAASNLAAISWTGIAATEDFTHVSLWTASSGGAFLRSGQLNGPDALIGTTYRIPIGQLTVSLPVAA